MLRAQIGQCAVFKTPTKLQHPYCNSFEAIAIGKLDLVLDRRNVSLFRDLATEPIFTPESVDPSILKVKRKLLAPQIGHFEKRSRNGWRKRQITLVVSHKARP